MSSQPAPDAPSDEALMRAVAGGDLERLGTLFDRHHLAVHALCTRLSRDPRMAEDLVQETFLRVLRFRQTYNGSSAFRTWLFRIVHNVCMDSHRRHRVQREVPLTAGASRISAPEESADSDLGTLVDAALGALTAEARTVLVLSRYHDLTYREIAAIVGSSPGAVRVRAHRALQALREQVERMRGALHDV